MRKLEYTRKRKELEQERSRLQSALDKVQARLSALDVVWLEIYNGGNDTVAAEKDASVEPATTPENASTGETAETEATDEATNNHYFKFIVNMVIDTTHERFGVREVLEKIRTKYPETSANRSTLSGLLKRMADDGQLRIVEPGRGRRPAVFEKVPMNTPKAASAN